LIALNLLNYSTSVASSVRVEVQDEAGYAIEGFAFEEMEALYGDHLGESVKSRDGSDLCALLGQTVRFLFMLQDADLYAVQIVNESK
jgi:hypothetical protein